jgi:hypothetical protein
MPALCVVVLDIFAEVHNAHWSLAKRCSNCPAISDNVADHRRATPCGAQLTSDDRAPRAHSDNVADSRAKRVPRGPGTVEAAGIRMIPARSPGRAQRDWSVRVGARTTRCRSVRGDLLPRGRRWMGRCGGRLGISWTSRPRGPTDSTPTSTRRLRPVCASRHPGRGPRFPGIPAALAGPENLTALRAQSPRDPRCVRRTRQFPCRRRKLGAGYTTNQAVSPRTGSAASLPTGPDRPIALAGGPNPAGESAEFA